MPYLRHRDSYTELCCNVIEAAYRSGSDSEGYSSLLNITPGGTVQAGNIPRPIKFCPWCGKEIAKWTTELTGPFKKEE